MDDQTLTKIVISAVKEQVRAGNTSKLVEKTGISKDWFYLIANGSNKNPTCANADKFLEAINHPLVTYLQKPNKAA